MNISIRPGSNEKFAAQMYGRNHGSQQEKGIRPVKKTE